MEQYLKLEADIMERGYNVDTRNGWTRKLFAHQIRIDMRGENFPAMTTKQLFFEPVKGELLWFAEGGVLTDFRMDNNRLKQLLGYPQNRKTIWSEDSESSRWKPKAQFPGDCGRIYGAQWRNWRGANGKVIDQLAVAIGNIRKDPWERQNKIVTARNPAELDDMCLPPCHERFQFNVTPGNDGKPKYLSVHMVQRSCDVFLGVPFNIASYALLLAMVAQVTGLEPYELVIDFMDVHIYHIHFKQVEEQLKRTPLPSPKLWLNPEIKEVDDFKMEDIKLVDYNHMGPLRAELAKDKSDL